MGEMSMYMWKYHLTNHATSWIYSLKNNFKSRLQFPMFLQVIFLNQNCNLSCAVRFRLIIFLFAEWIHYIWNNAISNIAQQCQNLNRDQTLIRCEYYIKWDCIMNTKHFLSCNRGFVGKSKNKWQAILECHYDVQHSGKSFAEKWSGNFM